MGLLSSVLMAAYELGMVVAARWESKETAFKPTQGVDRAWLREQGRWCEAEVGGSRGDPIRGGVESEQATARQ